MDEPSPAPDQLAKLRAIVDSFPGPGYAVVDGGHFPDLPAEFRRARLFARSLFLDTADPEVQAAGPWLVALGQAPDATDKVFALVGDRPAAVFWCCNAGETALWRHLRGLNMARIPKWAADGGRIQFLDKGAEDQYEAVLFRHFDPTVLGALLPIMQAEQFARFMRPAKELTFFAISYGGVKRILTDDRWPPAPPGLMMIRPDQIVALNNRRLTASHHRIVSYLREVAPDQVHRLSESAMIEHVLNSRLIGLELGLASERAHAKWAYLMLLTGGGIATSPGVKPFIAMKNKIPDKQMDIFMMSLVVAKQRLGEP